jgi:hypothetical protein
VKEINLTQGKIALVDDEDYEYLNQYKWCVHTSGNNEKFIYAVSRINKKLVRMHRLLLKVSKNIMVDHLDFNGLNNQKYNLRACTIAQNTQHQNKKPKGKNKYKGVSWYSAYKKWVVRICCNRKIIHIGYFLDEREAALKYHKEFAKLNKIED